MQVFQFETGQSGCDYFQWIDSDMVDWQKDVIDVLLAKKQRMVTDQNVLKARIKCLEHEKIRLSEQVQQMPRNAIAYTVGARDGVISNDQLFILLLFSAIVSVLVSGVVVKVFG